MSTSQEGHAKVTVSRISILGVLHHDNTIELTWAAWLADDTSMCWLDSVRPKL